MRRNRQHIEYRVDSLALLAGGQQEHGVNAIEQLSPETGAAQSDELLLSSA